MEYSSNEEYREFMWQSESYIAFDVKNLLGEHQYFEYIKYFKNIEEVKDFLRDKKTEDYTVNGQLM